MYRSFISISCLTILLLLSGCGSDHIPRHKNGFTYQGIYFGEHLSENFKYGIRDGCKTAKGVYSKSHRLFNQNDDYYNGWFLGRNKCRKLFDISKIKSDML